MQETEAAPPDRATLVNALRELEAAKERVERDAQAAADELREQLVEKLLPVLDNLDRTIASAAQAGDAPAVVEGVQLVRAQLEGVLRGYGLERLDAEGARFDPAVHDAIAAVPVWAPREHELIVEQIEPGYRFAGALLRPAKVVVGQYRH